MAGQHLLRWKFTDPHAGADPSEYVFAVNPKRMTSPYRAKTITYAVTTAQDGKALATEGMTPPKEWQFGGTSLTEDQLKAFETWLAKRTRIYVYDHYGRRYEVYLKELDSAPHEGRTNPTYPFRHEWTWTAVLFGNPVWPA